MGSSQTRNRTSVPRIARQILNHWTTNGALKLILDFIILKYPSTNKLGSEVQWWWADTGLFLLFSIHVGFNCIGRSSVCDSLGKDGDSGVGFSLPEVGTGAHDPEVPDRWAPGPSTAPPAFVSRRGCECLNWVCWENIPSGTDVWLFYSPSPRLGLALRFALANRMWQRWHVKGAVCSVTSDSLWPHGPQPARLLCPWNFPGKNTGAHCNFLLQGSLPAPEIELVSPASAGRFFSAALSGKPHGMWWVLANHALWGDHASKDCPQFRYQLQVLGARITLTSHQLVVNLGFPTTTFRLDNLLGKTHRAQEGAIFTITVVFRRVDAN